ncbi:flagellar brake protein [Sterolibacterium denitrificans]|nr:flagellar brake protein [Sterolibacterium denitrificans]
MTDETSAPPHTPPPPPSSSIPQNRFERLRDEEEKDYTLRSRSEILAVLRSMIEHNALMTVYFNQGQDFMLSSLLQLAADGRTLVLDVGSSAEMNQRALAADRLICVSNLDKIKIQFVLNGVDALQFEGRPAFLANTPEILVRLQRRDFYRFVLPVLQSIRCSIPFKSYDGGLQPIEVNVIDISAGGIGFLSKSESLGLSTDMLLENCRIDLPEIGILTVNMRIRSLYEVTLLTGARHERAGCQFIGLTAKQEMQLQRYIIKAERERKARELGMS